MQIILEREEYEKLRLNPLSVDFVERLRSLLKKGPVGGDLRRFVEDITDCLREYDRDLDRMSDEKFQLWP